MSEQPLPEPIVPVEPAEVPAHDPPEDGSDPAWEHVATTYHETLPPVMHDAVQLQLRRRGLDRLVSPNAAGGTANPASAMSRMMGARVRQPEPTPEPVAETSTEDTHPSEAELPTAVATTEPPEKPAATVTPLDALRRVAAAPATQAAVTTPERPGWPLSVVPDAEPVTVTTPAAGAENIVEVHESGRTDASALGAVATASEVMQAAALAGVANSTENQTARREQERTQAEAVVQAFGDAHNTLYQIGVDKEFHDCCMNDKDPVDPYGDMDKKHYWEIQAKLINERIAAEREAKGDSLELRALELAAATPLYVFEQTALSSDTHLPQDEYDHALDTVSDYNRLIRDFATDHRGALLRDMAQGLQYVVNISIENHARRHNGSQHVIEALRGARHELGYGQIARHTGRDVQPADRQQDRKGIDHVISDPAGPIPIDVKASLRQIGSHGKEEKAYKIANDGQVTMQSLTTDAEYKGGFFLPDGVAQIKAAKLDELLTLISAERQDILTNRRLRYRSSTAS